MLCEECHLVKVHGNLKKYRPILLDIADRIYGKDESDGSKEDV
jgi:hypothetical protein